MKLELLAEMLAGRLPCNLLVTPAPTFTPAEIRDLFSQVWHLVLNKWDRAAYVHAHCVISVSLTSLDATVVVERGWSTVNYLKGLNRTRIQAATVEDHLFCKFHGSSLAEWDPLPCAKKCFLAGKRQKRDRLHRRGRRDKGKKRAPRAKMLSFASAAVLAEMVGVWTPQMLVPAASSFGPHCGKPSDIGVLQEDVVWLLGSAHDGPPTREREGSEWPANF